MKRPLAQFLAPLLTRLRSDWRLLLSVHLVYTAVGVALLAPLAGIILRFLIGLSGQPALADQDILYFLLSPLGMASLILMAGVLIAIMALEQASLMAVGAAQATRGGSKVFGAILFAARRAPRIFIFCLWLVVRLLVIALPFLALGAAIAWVLLTDYDINYYLQARPPAFWTATILIGLVMTAMTALVTHRLVAWSLTLPLILFQDVAPKQSFHESRRLTQGHRKAVLWSLAVWAALALGLGALAATLVGGLGRWSAPLFFDRLPILVVVLGGLVSLWLLTNWLVGAFNASAFAFILLGLAERLVPGFERAEPKALPPETGSPRWPRTARWLTAALIAGTLIAVLVGAWLIDGMVIHDDISIVSHRGAAGKAPENTLIAIEQAIEDGTDWVEIDVQETADGEVVVIHDSDFMKLAGVNLKIWEASLSEVERIDVGSWLSPQFADARVPTLRQVLDSAHGKAGVVIELKYYGHDEDLERRVVEIVEAADMVDKVAVMSLESAGIQKIRALRPDWTIGLLSATGIGDLSKLDGDFLAVNMGMATPALVRRTQASGKRLFVWTVNDPVSMSRMMSLGVDGMITDEPEMARQVLTQRTELSPVERLLIHTAVLLGRPTPQRTYRDDSP
ncbi:glycerophosphodiester phosphodiesterase [Thiorhodococcus mannitoliphagus]|uniref:Glycerophosphodiester phosphodiesterase n=1 Tax=Thiorhodococcus mannitoliphagus TaxID=329406 RepID=A0A6P1DUJ9_9GAMM|nr:glycerophosphodiester phosphodiesterase [Thiorhodococcus mannitoliphagus]NEX22007.1 glycerophosphodiester phosphodiesterase [Thiorhodococcus mannitoliphagus]